VAPNMKRIWPCRPRSASLERTLAWRYCGQAEHGGASLIFDHFRFVAIFFAVAALNHHHVWS